MRVSLMNPHKAEMLENEQRSSNRRLDTLEAQINDRVRDVP